MFWGISLPEASDGRPLWLQAATSTEAIASKATLQSIGLTYGSHMVNIWLIYGWCMGNIWLNKCQNKLRGVLFFFLAHQLRKIWWIRQVLAPSTSGLFVGAAYATGATGRCRRVGRDVVVILVMNDGKCNGIWKKRKTVYIWWRYD